MTYVNSSFFAILLLPVLLQRLLHPGRLWRYFARQRQKDTNYAPLAEDEGNTVIKSDGEDGYTAEGGDVNDASMPEPMRGSTGFTGAAGIEAPGDKLSIRDTAWLSFEFSILWV